MAQFASYPRTPNVYAGDLVLISQDSSGLVKTAQVSAMVNAIAESYQAQIDSLIAQLEAALVVIGYIAPNVALDTQNDLRAIPTANGAIGVNVIKFITLSTSGTAQMWQFVAGTNADDWINYIRPNDYNSSTNAMVWKRIG